MSFKTRSARRIVKKTKRKFFFTLLLILFLIYATVQWILPNVIGSVGVMANSFKTPKQVVKPISETDTLAPPVLSFTYEATSSSTVIIKGYAQPGSKVKVFFDDELKQTVDVDTDGTFHTKDITLGFGTNNIYGKTINIKDDESLASKTYKLIFDNQKPELKVNEPSPDKKTTTGDQGRLYVVGTTETDAQVFVNNIQQIIDSKGEFHTFIPLNSGENTVTIKAVDKASNVSEITRTVTFENASPSPSPLPTP